MWKSSDMIKLGLMFAIVTGVCRIFKSTASTIVKKQQHHNPNFTDFEFLSNDTQCMISNHAMTRKIALQKQNNT